MSDQKGSECLLSLAFLLFREVHLLSWGRGPQTLRGSPSPARGIPASPQGAGAGGAAESRVRERKGAGVRKSPGEGWGGHRLGTAMRARRLRASARPSAVLGSGVRAGALLCRLRLHKSS